MTVLSEGVMTVTAKMAAASYPSPQQVQTILQGTSSQLDLSLITPSVWIAQGATATVPLVARVLSNGGPVSGGTLNYQISQGVATLSAASAQTDLNGYGSGSLQVSSIATGVQGSVCVAPNNSPCQLFNATGVPSSSLQVQAGVAGTPKVIPRRG